jgi:hypothetical protein
MSSECHDDSWHERFQVTAVPKHSPKFLTAVPNSIVAPKRPLVMSEVDWRRIEVAYASPLSANVRKKIIKTTQQFIDWEWAEREARPIQEAQKEIEAYKKAVANFLQSLDADTDTSAIVQHMISKNFNCRALTRGDPFFFLETVLPELEAACDRALSKLAPTPTIITLKQGDVWKWWIRALVKVLEESSLPTSVRKDSDKSADLSPFVLLVRELQNCLPKECNFPQHSDRALAEAIVRAKRGRLGAQTPPSAT